MLILSVLLRLRVMQKALQLPLFSFCSFPTANLDGMAKVACPIFQICWASQLWPNSNTLENVFMKVLSVVIQGACDH